MTPEINARIAELLPKIAFAVGFDVEDLDAKLFLQMTVEAGVQDMLTSGVSEAEIEVNAIVPSALIIFVNDNLNTSGGNYKTSSMYVSCVDKLREQAIAEVTIV